METQNTVIDLTEARVAGFEFAKDIPKYNRDHLSDGMDEDDARETSMALWHDAQDNSRQYSPFEFTAKALNDADNSEEAWEAFDAGINEAFEAGWKDVLRFFTFKS